MKKVPMLITIVILVILFHPFLAVAQTFSGTTKDSLTGSLLPGVKAEIVALKLSTLSDSQGKFSLVIPTTEIIIPEDRKAFLKIFYNPSRNLFLGNGEENVFIEVRNSKGEIMKGDKLSPGQYFAFWHLAGASGVFKFLNIAGQNQSYVLRIEKAGNSLAKTSAASYILNFSKIGYLPLTLNVTGGQSNLLAKLSPVPANITGIVKIDSTGQVNAKGIITDN